MESARWFRSGSVWALRAPYVCRDALRQIPGMRWSPDAKAWVGGPDLVDPVTKMLVAGGLTIGYVPELDPPSAKARAPLADEALDGRLRPYQLDALSFINDVSVDGGVLLALPMGAGKSLCAIRAAEREGGLTLIICPGMVKGVWGGLKGEIRKWHPGADVRVCSTRTVDPGVLVGLSRDSFVVANFEILDDHKTGRLLENGKPERASSPWVDALGRIPFTAVVVDEAHGIKNRAGARTSAIKTLSQKLGADNHLRIAQTGTPIWNRPADIWRNS